MYFYMSPGLFHHLNKINKNVIIFQPVKHTFLHVDKLNKNKHYSNIHLQKFIVIQYLRTCLIHYLQ